MAVKVKIVFDNTELIKAATNAAIENALTVVGQTCADDSADACPVDTGRLANSITSHVLGKTAYIGTNVEYAPYVHEGHRTPKGNTVEPRRFLKDTLMNNAEDYKNMIATILRGALH